MSISATNPSRPATCSVRPQRVVDGRPAFDDDGDFLARQQFEQQPVKDQFPGVVGQEEDVPGASAAAKNSASITIERRRKGAFQRGGDLLRRQVALDAKINDVGGDGEFHGGGGADSLPPAAASRQPGNSANASRLDSSLIAR